MDIPNAHGQPQDQRRFSRCEFPLVAAPEIERLILDRLADREPTSMVRLGDGEGMVLAGHRT